ncbi:putative six-bladed beta-propeller -like protein [Neofusicoccum parvum UCRNP2]|uniref:Putative six-bladed beta-propeller-like protein n=1 Tax=Botryosphaeria parva (strain UCR-NP2) TaxID=1287680 RepID=R1GFM1_BOTPV|nr:putative six-bladed beta-propeller -like protein [Neofusicoccum parvum UCRNP2]
MAADDIHVVPVTQLPPNSWFEGFAIRPNGHILATRLDEPELYTFDPQDPGAQPQLVHTFPDANGLVNLCPIDGAPDEYAVIAATVELQAVQFDSAVIWRVTLKDGEPPRIKEIARVPDSGFCIGVTAACPRTLLIADSYKNCIWRLDVPTGASAVLVADDTMKAATDEDYFGINRLRIAHGFLWYTNTSAGLLCRVPIALDPADGVKTTGPVEIITANLPHCDGLAITDDGNAIFTCNYMAGLVWRVDMDADGKGVATILTRGLSSPTSVELARAPDDPARVNLYVTCCGGEAGVGWVNEDDRLSEMDRLNLDIAAVTVTEEVVEVVVVEETSTSSS